MNRDDWIAIIGGAVFALLLTCSMTLAAEPVTIDCNLVRHYVAEHGKAKALAWAIKEGYSWRQIAEAKRCVTSR